MTINTEFVQNKDHVSLSTSFFCPKFQGKLLFSFIPVSIVQETLNFAEFMTFWLSLTWFSITFTKKNLAEISTSLKDQLGMPKIKDHQ